MILTFYPSDCRYHSMRSQSQMAQPLLPKSLFYAIFGVPVSKILTFGFQLRSPLQIL
ncbi:hypothetical protein [Kamptonema sp. UHCC 0994]|uniref:hypothetical protein n=1 Tax=Kamptonema sp. UHCC 0994 TaxID=3031329 RepID=UPI0023BA05E3|nr:hypothetical protein [Kamptonema sp. UHCC 0994]MDF0552627.1 hypothetical protein [Kamptonema sp. UHCC 0994]